MGIQEKVIYTDRDFHLKSGFTKKLPTLNISLSQNWTDLYLMNTKVFTCRHLLEGFEDWYVGHSSPLADFKVDCAQHDRPEVHTIAVFYTWEYL